MSEEQKDVKSYWSEGGQIFFNCGKAYGVSTDLSSICLGEEGKILQALSDNKSMGINTIDNILRREINNRGCEDVTPRIRTRGHRRTNKRFRVGN